jgi:hypothetical protein
MIDRYTKKNKYGGTHWMIKYDPLFHIHINGTSDGNFVIDFKEWKIIHYKTHFSFVSNRNLEQTIIDSLNRVKSFLMNYEKIDYNQSYHLPRQQEIMEFFNKYYKNSL